MGRGREGGRKGSFAPKRKRREVELHPFVNLLFQPSFPLWSPCLHSCLPLSSRSRRRILPVLDRSFSYSNCCELLVHLWTNKKRKGSEEGRWQTDKRSARDGGYREEKEGERRERRGNTDHLTRNANESKTLQACRRSTENEAGSFVDLSMAGMREMPRLHSFIPLVAAGFLSLPN